MTFDKFRYRQYSAQSDNLTKTSNFDTWDLCGRPTSTKLTTQPPIQLCFLTLYQFSSDIEQFFRIKVCAEKFVFYQISNSSASFQYNPQSRERNDRAFFHANFNAERFFNFVGGETLVFNKMPLTGTIYQIYGTRSSIVSKNEQQCPLILLTLNG